MKKKIAFICSGGGVPAIESIGGMMDSLKDNFNIIPDKVWACSGGAIPSSLYFKNIRITSLYEKYKVSDMMKMRDPIEVASGKSLMDNSNLKILLEESIGYEFNKNLIVNVTDKYKKTTYYVYGNCITVLTSSGFPEVLPTQLLSVDGWELNSFETNNEIRNIKMSEVTLDSVECYDGGVYDVIPVPPKTELDNFDEIYILVSSQVPMINVKDSDRLSYIIDLMLSTMEREYHELLRHYSYYDKIKILRPCPIDAPMFDWSNNLCCYKNAYDYISELNLGDK